MESLSNVMNGKTTVVGNFGGIFEMAVDGLEDGLETFSIADDLRKKKINLLHFFKIKNKQKNKNLREIKTNLSKSPASGVL